MNHAERMAENFKRIDVRVKGFYIALNKNLKKILVPPGSGLKLVYSDRISQYLTEAICWNIEKYVQIQPPAISQNSQHKEY